MSKKPKFKVGDKVLYINKVGVVQRVVTSCYILVKFSLGPYYLLSNGENVSLYKDPVDKFKPKCKYGRLMR